MDRKEKMTRVLKEFRKRYGYEHSHGRPFETLITTIISQRNTDSSTEKISRELLGAARTPEGIVGMPMKKLQKIVRPAGAWRNKSRNIRETSRIVWKRYRGKVPGKREILMELPGVGPKTADIVLMYGFGIPSIAVDTHVNRIPRRLGLVSKDASIHEVKEELEKLVPKRQWYLVNHGFVSFGKEICRSARPRCHDCPFLKFCPYGRKLARQ